MSSRRDRPTSAPGPDETKVTRTSGGFVFREIGSSERWIWVGSEDDLTPVQR